MSTITCIALHTAPCIGYVSPGGDHGPHPCLPSSTPARENHPSIVCLLSLCRSLCCGIVLVSGEGVPLRPDGGVRGLGRPFSSFPLCSLSLGLCRQGIFPAGAMPITASAVQRATSSLLKLGGGGTSVSCQLCPALPVHKSFGCDLLVPVYWPSRLRSRPMASRGFGGKGVLQRVVSHLYPYVACCCPSCRLLACLRLDL